MQYDTREIRRIARKVGAAAERVRGIGGHGLSGVAQPLEGTFQGKAATTLDTRLEEMRGELRSLRQGLNSISDELYQFANRLDAADQQARDIIQSK